MGGTDIQEARRPHRIAVQTNGERHLIRRGKRLREPSVEVARPGHEAEDRNIRGRPLQGLAMTFPKQHEADKAPLEQLLRPDPHQRR
jgi:hypothetical protein